MCATSFVVSKLLFYHFILKALSMCVFSQSKLPVLVKSLFTSLDLSGQTWVFDYLCFPFMLPVHPVFSSQPCLLTLCLCLFFSV